MTMTMMFRFYDLMITLSLFLIFFSHSCLFFFLLSAFWMLKVRSLYILLEYFHTPSFEISFVI